MTWGRCARWKWVVALLLVAAVVSCSSDEVQPPATPELLPAPSAEQLEKAIAFETRAAQTGAANSYQQELSYTLEFIGQNPVVRQGRASFTATPQLSEVTVESGGERATLWRDGERNAILWCDSGTCRSLEQTLPPGMEVVGSIWMQAVTVLNTIDPGVIAPVVSLRSASTTQLWEVTRQLGGAEYRCSLQQGEIGGEVVRAERCWDDGGAVVFFETTGGRIEQLEKRSGGNVALPGTLS